MEAWVTERAREINRTLDENPGIACILVRDPPRVKTHSLIIGVMRWLRGQAQGYIDRGEPFWRGAQVELEMLLDGTHPDPRPGLIITPEDPDGFHVDQILARGYGYKGQEQWIKSEVERIAFHVDSDAYFTICEMLQVPLTPELDALHCIHELDTFIADHLEIIKQPLPPENYIPPGLAINLERARLRGHDISDRIAGTNLDPALSPDDSEGPATDSEADEPALNPEADGTEATEEQAMQLVGSSALT